MASEPGRPELGLSVQGATKTFARGWFRRAESPAIDDVDLVVHRGEVVGLIGESGSGKTTLARIAAGLMPPDTGRVEVLGQDIRSMPAAELRRFRKRVQLLFQSPSAHLNPGLTVQANLLASARLHCPGQPGSAASEVLARVGLTERAEAFAHELSGGEQRRVGLAAVLLADPDVVIADEPTAGLDAELKGGLIDLLLAHRRTERATLIISHDLPLVAYACTHMVVMFAGHIVETFATHELGTAKHHPYTQSLLYAAGMAEETTIMEGVAVGRVPLGCPYRGACPFSTDACQTKRPRLRQHTATHQVACHAVEQP